MLPLIFISYAHDSEFHKARVLALADQLRSQGVDVDFDQYQEHPHEGWPKWMERQVANADVVLVVPSPLYLERFTQSDGEKASGGRFEGSLISNRLYAQACSYEQFAVVAVDPAGHKYVPPILAGCPRYNAFDGPGYDDLYRFLTKQAAVSKPPLGPARQLSPRRPGHAVSLTPGRITEFWELCRELKPLFERNGETFRAFGPRSGANDGNLEGFDVELWHRARQNDIRPTNRVITALIDEHSDLIPREYSGVFKKLRRHIFAFDAHCDDPDVDYRNHQFPREVLTIVNDHVSRHVS